MAKTPDTDMGGSGGRFFTTDWSQVFGARTEDEDRRRRVLGDLARQYWRPVYCYLRKRGHNNELAKDLTQDFFTGPVLSKELFQIADPNKGRLRTLLLGALGHLVASHFRKKGRQKRSGDRPTVSLPETDEHSVPIPANCATPYGLKTRPDLLAMLARRILGTTDGLL